MLMEVGLTLNIKSAMKRQENLDLQSLFSMEKYPSEKFSGEVNPRRTEINKMISKPYTWLTRVVKNCRVGRKPAE